MLQLEAAPKEGLWTWQRGLLGWQGDQGAAETGRMAKLWVSWGGRAAALVQGGDRRQPCPGLYWLAKSRRQKLG